MPATYKDNGGSVNGSNKVFTYDFPVLQTEDIKVALNGVTQATTKYTPSLSPANITFNNTSIDSSVQESDGSPKSGVTVRVYRETTVGKNTGDEDPKAVFAAGSSIRAGDLNANIEQALFGIHERQEQLILAEELDTGAVTSAKILDGTIVNADISATAEIEVTKLQDGLPRQLLQTNADNTTVAWTSDVELPGTLDVNGVVDFDQTLNVDGAVTIGGTLQVTGTTTAAAINASGAVGVDGNFDVNTNKFTVASSSGNTTVAGTLGVTGLSTLASVDINGGAVDGTTIGASSAAAGTFTTGTIATADINGGAIDGTIIGANSAAAGTFTNGTIATADINGGAIDGTTIGANSAAAGTFTTGTIATADINGGAIDGTTIGANSAAAGTFTTVNASGAITGDLTGNADTATDLAAATKITASEQAAHTVNDTTYFTTAASDAKYYRKGSADDIEESGVPWSGNDSTVATTAAIDKRIIDLVDDVGGFVPIANETSFPAANPDINNPGTGGTIVSVAAASEALPDGDTATLSGSTLTISNGRGTGNAVIITGAPSTIPSGFGFLVETTSTDHTYSFHRLVPKATEVTTVAGKATEITTCHTNITNINAVASNATNINAVAADATDIGAVAGKATEIGRLGTADAVADMNTLGTAAIVEDMNLLGTAACVADMALLGDSAVIADMATIADTSNLITNIGTVAGIDTEITTVAGIQAAVSTTASNSANVNSFANTYQIASSAPSTDGGGNALAAGDLYFDTSASELKVRNAANNAWQGGVTATGNLIAKGGDEFTGAVGFTDGSTSTPSIYNVGDTNTGIYFGAADEVDVTVGGTTRLEINSDGIDITGNITVSGNVDGKDVSTLTGTPEGTAVLSTGESGGTKFLREDGDGSCSWQTVNTDLSADTTPQLGGNLDVLDKAIITSTGSSQNIVIDPNEGALVINEKATTGAAQIESESGKDLRLYAGPGNGAYIQLGNGANGAVQLIPNGTGITSFGGSSLKLGLGSSQFTVTTHQSGAHIKLEPAGTSGNITVKSGANEDIEITPNGTGDVVIDGLKYPQADGSAGEFLKTNGSGQLSWDTPATVGGATGTDFNDGVKARFGTGNDLEIYHQADSYSYIQDSFGNLRIDSDIIQLRSKTGYEQYLKGTLNGSVELYHDNVKTFKTVATGIQVQGAESGHGEIYIYADEGDDNADKYLLQSGTDNAFYIKNYTAGSWEVNLKTTGNGNVELYYDNSKKFETTSSGATITGGTTITGDLFCDNASHAGFDLYWNSSAKQFKLSDNVEGLYGDGGDLQIYHTGTHSWIENTNGNLYLYAPADSSLINRADEWQVTNTAESEYIMRGTHDSACRFFFDGVEKLATSSSGITVTGGVTATTITGSGNAEFSGNYVTCIGANYNAFWDKAGSKFKFNDNAYASFGTGDDLIAYHNGSDSYLDHQGTGDLYIQTSSSGDDVTIKAVDDINLMPQGGESGIHVIGNGGVELYYDNTKTFETTSTGNTVAGDKDIRFTNGTWTGEVAGKIQLSGNLLYIQGGSNGLQFRSHDGSGWGGWNINSNGHFIPANNNSMDIGSSSNRVRNVYTNDLNLSNEGSTNDVDGTWGSFTMQEGEDDLFLINRRNGKKYKFNLTEVN